MGGPVGSIGMERCSLRKLRSSSLARPSSSGCGSISIRPGNIVPAGLRTTRKNSTDNCERPNQGSDSF